MSSNKTPLPPPAEPRYGRPFDPWNSVATGHQRAETRGPQGWRESRSAKLGGQFRAGHSGGGRVPDSVGFGAPEYDERRRVFVPREVRAAARSSVVDMLRRPGSMRGGTPPQGGDTAPLEETVDGDCCYVGGYGAHREATTEERVAARRGEKQDEEREAQIIESSGRARRGIFDGLVVYVNGSTHPLISDHRLKRVLAENGARMSLHLGRRQVTHVILGRPAAGAGPGGGGAGGGLAGGKLEREIRRVGGCGVKYVGVEWVLESVKAGVRLPEARFSNVKVAAKGQPSVYGAFSKPPPE
ncbi:DNA repair protein REV1 [Pleurostoma richardsiae]|uniref:DNA repair protein REV1 n=1 Tax=Pleurostoma richardsiae TaxID=41990 RepID=A0AA38VPK5_9PEZI|nr:DNA repair protein REV1 [Pleurostoma richardsiae]